MDQRTLVTLREWASEAAALRERFSEGGTVEAVDLATVWQGIGAVLGALIMDGEQAQPIRSTATAESETR